MPNSNPTRGYADLEIHIRPRRDAGYPVDITLDDQQEFTRGYLSTDVLPWVPTGDRTNDGRKLFDKLFADRNLGEAWAQARGKASRRRVRLWIDVDAAELHQLPWELLQKGAVPLSAQADTPFSRYLPIDLVWGEPIKERPIRVLVVISNPRDLKSSYDLPPVDVETEWSVLQEAFSGFGSDQLYYKRLDAPVTPSNLQKELRARDGYHVLHFVGHGTFGAQSQRAMLFMENEHRDSLLFSDAQMLGLLAGQAVKPRLVFLAACESARRSTADAFRGLGPALIQGGVPAVAAMQDTVTVETAREFSATFYRQLLSHGLVDLAVNEARNTLLVTGRPDAAVPVLFMRVQDGQLFVPATSPAGTTDPQPQDPAPVELPVAPDQVNPIKLRQAMVSAYNKPDLVTLCTDLAFQYGNHSVEYDNLRGEALSSKVLELIQWHIRRRRLGDLVTKVLQDHPYVAEDLV